MKNQYISLNNDVLMPQLGLGVYKSGGKTKQAVLDALETGYRHIDTAAFYGNEKDVGEAIRESGIQRKDIFVTTKVWNEDIRQDNIREAFEKSREALGIDQIDLYLIHWPVPGHYVNAWHELEKLYAEKDVRAIGVSNFQMSHLMDIMAHSKTVPAVNQIECHPYLNQQSLRLFCKGTNIGITAWSPIGRGRILEEKAILELAEKYKRTPAQIVLRWEVQNDIIVIPKSVHKERIEENSRIFDFELSSEDVQRINALDQNQRFGPDPDNFDF